MPINPPQHNPHNDHYLKEDGRSTASDLCIEGCLAMLHKQGFIFKFLEWIAFLHPVVKCAISLPCQLKILYFNRMFYGE